MIKVTIVSSAVRLMSGIGKTSGKPYNLAFQDAYFHTVDKEGILAPFPQKVEIFAPKDAQGNPDPYAPGEYQLAPFSVFVDRQGKLAIEPLLVPLKSSAARPTPAN
jgi:hypothetical protein